MIKAKTVFVLGAGASMPYGFPSGAQLRESICGAHNEGHWLQDYLDKKVGIEPARVKEFARAFLRSGVASIDSFLGRRPEFLEVGRYVIAAELAKKEIAARFESDTIDDHWYRTLWNALIEEVNSLESLSENQVTFVSFNYDRSLEHYLHQATKNTFGKSDQDSLAAWKRLRIIHVYGQLGDYHYHPGEGRRQYTDEVASVDLAVAAGGIHLMPEERGDATFAAAWAAFSHAEIICFLGFGFDPLNVRRLDLATVLAQKKAQRQRLPSIFASTYQRTASENSRAAGILCPGREWSTYDERNVMTLRNSGVLL